MDDIHKPNKSIRDISLNRQKRGRVLKKMPAPKLENKKIKIDKEEEAEPQFVPEEERVAGAPSWFFKFSALLTVIFLILGFLGIFIFWGSGAKLFVSVKTMEVVIDDVFTLTKKTDGIPFETINITKEGSQTVPTSGERNIERPATGVIVIYNDYSSSNQRLIKNTRFATAEGLIFRIGSSVVVPGQKIVNGEKVPGSVEAAVYADSPGEEYNVGLTDFVIPGFKGDPRFEKFYARSKTPMTGGFKGLIKIASKEDVEIARNKITEELTKAVNEEYETQTPAGFVNIKSLRKIISQNLSDDESGEVLVKVVGHGVLIKKEDLGGEIALKTVGEFDLSNETVVVENLNVLTITPTSPDIDISSAEEIKVAISGKPKLLWTFDKEKLASDLAGLPKTRLSEVLGAYPGISGAEVTIKPFWSSRFPEDPKKIKIQDDK